MDTLTRHPRFPSIRMRCPKSSPKLVIPAAALRRNCGDAGGETPVGRIDTVRWNGADGTPPKRVVNFSDFLSAGSKVLRVTIAGNHPSPTTATNCLLTEIRDVSSVSPPFTGFSSGRSQLNRVVSSRDLCLYRCPSGG